MTKVSPKGLAIKEIKEDGNKKTINRRCHFCLLYLQPGKEKWKQGYEH